MPANGIVHSVFRGFRRFADRKKVGLNRQFITS